MCYFTLNLNVSSKLRSEVYTGLYMNIYATISQNLWFPFFLFLLLFSNFCTNYLPCFYIRSSPPCIGIRSTLPCYNLLCFLLFDHRSFWVNGYVLWLYLTISLHVLCSSMVFLYIHLFRNLNCVSKSTLPKLFQILCFITFLCKIDRKPIQITEVSYNKSPLLRPQEKGLDYEQVLFVKRSYIPGV